MPDGLVSASHDPGRWAVWVPALCFTERGGVSWEQAEGRMTGTQTQRWLPLGSSPVLVPLQAHAAAWGREHVPAESICVTEGNLMHCLPTHGISPTPPKALWVLPVSRAFYVFPSQDIAITVPQQASSCISNGNSGLQGPRWLSWGRRQAEMFALSLLPHAAEGHRTELSPAAQPPFSAGWAPAGSLVPTQHGRGILLGRWTHMPSVSRCSAGKTWFPSQTLSTPSFIQIEETQPLCAQPVPQTDFCLNVPVIPSTLEFLSIVPHGLHQRAWVLQHQVGDCP